MIRTRAAAVVVALLAGAATAVPSTPAAACSPESARAALRGPIPETILLETLNVRLSAKKKSYRPGDVAVVHVKVTRPANRDPVGAGIHIPSPVGAPAPGVRVGVGLSLGRAFLYAGGTTNAVGEETLKFRLPNGAPSGPADARALAYRRHVETICANVDEVGFAREGRLFVVRG